MKRAFLKINTANGKTIVAVNPKYFRSAEVENILPRQKEFGLGTQDKF